MRKNLHLTLSILVSMLACSSVVADKSITNEDEHIKVCAKIDSIGRIYPLQGTDGRMRWEINFTVIKNLNNLASKIPAVGEKLHKFIHSPSRDFGSSPEESEGKNFLITLISQNDSWFILKGQKNTVFCPDI